MDVEVVPADRSIIKMSCSEYYLAKIDGELSLDIAVSSTMFVNTDADIKGSDWRWIVDVEADLTMATSGDSWGVIDDEAVDEATVLKVYQSFLYPSLRCIRNPKP